MEKEKQIPNETQTVKDAQKTPQDNRIRSLISNLNDPIMLRRTEKILQDHSEE